MSLSPPNFDPDATVRSFAVGQELFNRYQLVSVLGRGGMGVVWKTRDRSLNRDVALKFLPEVVALDEESVGELRRETTRSLELTHPNIVRVHDFLHEGNLAAISMELVNGASLVALKQREVNRVLTVAQLEPIVEQLCSALDYAHNDAKIVHRDLKPANVMVTDEGRVKILDFGIAASISESASRVTNRGTAGTLNFMSPQQLLGKSPSAADDWYAVGAMMYDLLSGKPPFFRGDVPTQILNAVPEPLGVRREEFCVSGDPIPEAWEGTIRALLAKETADRPKNGIEVLEMLRGKRPSSQAMKLPPQEPPKGPRRLEGQAEPKKRNVLWPWLAYLLVAVIGLGYYLGIAAPEKRRRTELARLETEAKAAQTIQEQARLAAEAETLRTNQEKEKRARVEEKARAEALALAEANRIANLRGGVIVRTTPAGAEVKLGVLAVEKSPVTLREVKLGKYPLRITLDGYEPYEGQVEVKENDFADMDVAMERSTGTVRVDSEPKGMEFELRAGGWVARGTTPVDVEKVPTGNGEVLLRRAGWSDQKRQVKIVRRETVVVRGEFAAGKVAISTQPSGARVESSDGKILGQTPLLINELVPGPVSYRLTMEGHEPELLKGQVEGKKTLELSTNLRKLEKPQEGQAYTIPGLGLELVALAPGQFVMGSGNGDPDEKPSHDVTLTMSYWMGKYVVTQGEWAAVMGSHPSHFKGERLPIENVSYQDALEFCRKLSESERAAGRVPEGFAYNLPTEAQWEYACRAGTKGDYAGDLEAMGWYDKNSGDSTHPVGQKKPNPWGLYDMHGNVCEWCLDWFGAYAAGPVNNPRGPASGSYRVVRGGGWNFSAGGCRSARRSSSAPDNKYVSLGFRVALSPTR